MILACFFLYVQTCIISLGLGVGAGLPDLVLERRGGRGRPGDSLPDNCKLYVGNLSHSTTDAQLHQMFEQFGPVLHASVINDTITHQSRGFGFVHMDSPAAASTAAQQAHGKVGTPRLPLLWA